MKKIAITMGDPGGVGPEIIVKALSSAEIREICIPVVIGDRLVIEEAMHMLNLPLKLRVLKSPEESGGERETIDLIDMKLLGKFMGGKPTAEGGRACASYIKKAAELALDKKVDAVVTAPISKEALKMAGIRWPGHTEMLAELTGTDYYAMMLAGGPLKVILVTIHTSLKSVPEMITRERVLKTIRLAKKACDMMEIENPEIAVAGLNPHAGEAGIFGDEEIKEIIPAIEDAKKEGIQVTGPLPPDTIFHKAYKGEFDIVVCMYHDQGLIPLKMIAFEQGVNVTVGLPIIRTSSDHGTAYDIAWKGIANSSSMIEAIKMAVKLKI
ncbi:MAG: 4-hydroxythreonine-4-phosphate dehydrogenase [Nitrospirae bacterium]|nr:MAG: 4-hydroxythreonine-4-phosphate dehydrogenase [Nitrospirota bacterium]